MRTFFCLITAVLSGLCVSARGVQDSIPPYRPVAAAYTVGIGSAHICNTYLTPLHYDGIGLSLNYERMQAMAFNPESWVMRLDGSLNIDATHNPAHNANMTGLHVRAGWSMMHRWRFKSMHGLTLYGGAFTDISLGGLLLARNGNNPAQAEAAWTIGAAAMASCRTDIGRLPVTFRYSVRLPLTGMFFSPDYGELYYEIYLGNHSGLVHAAWPGNYFRLDNLLTADLHLGNTSLRIGYACDIFSSKTSGIVSRNTAHRFVLGVTTEFITIGRKRGIDSHARIISAIY